MREKLEKLRLEAKRKIDEATNEKELEAVRVEFLGRRQGKITQILRNITDLSPQDRPLVGQLVNQIKRAVQEDLKRREKEISQEEKEEWVDITLPGKKPLLGRLHPITQTLEEIKRIFIGLGFQVVRGPEVETEYYNFEALNMPRYHPG
jgi:phenylalanyl-tRNA synthetase alpha chain